MAEIEKSGLPGAAAGGRSPCSRRIGVAVRGVRDGAVRVKVRAMSLRMECVLAAFMISRSMSVDAVCKMRFTGLPSI